MEREGYERTKSGRRRRGKDGGSEGMGKRNAFHTRKKRKRVRKKESD